MKQLSILAAVTSAALSIAGCSSNSSNQSGSNPPASQSTTQTGASGTTLAARGTEVDAVVQQAISSAKNKQGDTFTLTEKDTFFHKNPALSGAAIDAHVENISPAGPLHKATMTVVFDDVRLPDGSTAPIHATILSMGDFEPKSHTMRNIGIVIGSAVVGHMLTKHSGNKMGTLAGAAAGMALASGLKSNIEVKPGTLVRLKLTDDLTTTPVPATP
jgi:outer membrane lipoprotein SlyB